MKKLITKDTEINDILTMDILVSNQSELIVKGIVTGDIFIEKNSSVIIFGMVNGNINNKGTCEIHGIVHGVLIGEKIKVAQNVIINVDH